MEEQTVRVTVESITRLENGWYQVKAFYGMPLVMSKSSNGSVERARAERKAKKDAYDGITSLFFPAPPKLCPRIGQVLTITLRSAEITEEAARGDTYTLDYCCSNCNLPFYHIIPMGEVAPEKAACPCPHCGCEDTATQTENAHLGGNWPKV